VEVFLLLFITHCRGEIQERHTQRGLEEGSEKGTKGDSFSFSGFSK